MAVTIDIGDALDIHPKNKQDLGDRLARWALAKTYGKDLVYSGPLYRSMEKSGKQIVLHCFKLRGILPSRPPLSNRREHEQPPTWVEVDTAG